MSALPEINIKAADRNVRPTQSTLKAADRNVRPTRSIKMDRNNN